MVDDTSNIDRHGSKLTKFVCPSPVGGLPLGMIITSRADEKTKDEAFKVFKSLLPDDAFYGRGSRGPKHFMTDDDSCERKCLQNSWDESVLLLCIFHVFQAVNTWLWDAKHKIDKSDRKPLYRLIKAIVYSPTEEKFYENIRKMRADKIFKKYQNLAKHFDEKLLPRHEEWAMFVRHRENYSTHNQNTNNYVEISFRWVKDAQLGRLRAYNLMNLVEMTFDDNKHYSQR